MILYRSKTKKSYYLNPRGFPIGINLPDRTLFRRSIQSDTLQLREDDVLIIYTDGITEAMNPNRERFGDERFLTTIRKFGNKKVKPLVENIREEIITFTEEFAQSDDITLVAIREKLRAEDVLFNMRIRLMHLVDDERVNVKEACREVGVSTSTYYKYRKLYLEHGPEGLKEKVHRSEIEERHISIEDKAKILDVIKQNPEFGPKRISEELNTQKYGSIQIDEKRIYDELVRSRLNTKELRLAYIERGGRGKRMKPPGTPFLSLDGQVIMDTGVKKQPKFHTPPKEFSGFSESFEQSEPEEPKKIEPIRSYESQGPDRIEKKRLSDKISQEMEEAINLLDIREVDSEADKQLTKEDLFTAEDLKDKIDFHKVVHNQDSELDEESGEEEVRPFNDLVDQLLDVDDMTESQNYRDSDISSIIEETESEAASLSSENDRSGVRGSVADELFEQEIRSKGASIPGKRRGDRDKEKSFEELFNMLNFEQVPVTADETGSAQKKSSAAQDLHCQRYLESGQWFYRQELYAKAIDEFSKAIEMNSQFIEAYQCLGDAYFRLGQLEKARDTYEKIRKMDPGNTDVLENLGVIHANCGDYKKAVWQWGEVLKRHPHRGDIIERIKRMQKVIRQRSV